MLMLKEIIKKLYLFGLKYLFNVIEKYYKIFVFVYIKYLFDIVKI
jgi:hypothetical protein